MLFIVVGSPKMFVFFIQYYLLILHLLDMCFFL